MTSPALVKEICIKEDGPVDDAVVARTSETVLEAFSVPTHEPISKRPRILEECEIARGAEGVVSRIMFLGRPAIRKERFPKRYRHPDLDKKLTSRRLAQEARTLLRLRRVGVPAPAVYSVDLNKSTIILEDVGMLTLRDFLAASKLEDALRTVSVAGLIIRKMHDADIIHGDLTTSNMVIQLGSYPEQVFLIDFGLSSNSSAEEDKAVDLYVLERAVIAAHPDRADMLNASFFESYGQHDEGRGRNAVVVKLDEVRARGRKRDMTG